MAVASYVGGRSPNARGSRPPVLLGVAPWRPPPTPGWAPRGAADTSYPVFALQLALLGAGFGLTVRTDHERRRRPCSRRPARLGRVGRDGRAPARSVGRTVGAHGLGAGAIQRPAARRSSCRRSPTPTSKTALLAAQETLTAEAIAETFLVSAAVTAIGVAAALTMRRLALIRPRIPTPIPIPTWTKQENPCSPGCNAT